MKTILLADDSITIQKVVELTFSDGDYRVFCVGNGAQALRKIPEIRPDIVLLDIVMPEKNGYEVCEALRADPATAAIPVLLLSGTFEPFDRARAEAAGARGHVTKPFESHTLVQRVEELLAQASLGPPSPPSPTVAAAPPSAATFTGAQTVTGTVHAGPPPPPAEMPAAGPRPAFPGPEPDAGGAYLGFADLAVGEEEQVVRDRYDEVDAAPPAHDSTGRGADLSASTDASGGEAEPGFEGFVSGYDMPEPAASPDSDAPVVTPRPAAPFRPSDVQARTTAPARGDSEPGGAETPDLLAEATLDRLAEMVVRKMSERVVREIAWEVIPGVAETIVRQRIKELEEREP